MIRYLCILAVLLLTCGTQIPGFVMPSWANTIAGFMLFGFAAYIVWDWTRDGWTGIGKKAGKTVVEFGTGLREVKTSFESARGVTPQTGARAENDNQRGSHEA